MKKLLIILFLLIVSFNLFAAEFFISPCSKGTGFNPISYSFKDKNTSVEKARVGVYGSVGSTIEINILYCDYFSLTPAIRYSYLKDSSSISLSLGFSYVSNGYKNFGWSCGIDIGAGYEIFFPNNPVIQNKDITSKLEISIQLKIELMLKNNLFFGVAIGGNIIPGMYKEEKEYIRGMIEPYIGYRIAI